MKLGRSGADTQYKRANKQVSHQEHKHFLRVVFPMRTRLYFLRTQPIYWSTCSYSLLRLMLMHAIKLVPSSKYCLICAETTVGRINKQLTTTETAYITQLCVWDVFNHKLQVGITSAVLAVLSDTLTSVVLYANAALSCSSSCPIETNTCSMIMHKHTSKTKHNLQHV